MRFKSILKTSALPLLLVSSFTQAQTLDIEISNLTHGMFFTPLLVSSHGESLHLFESGELASDELKILAEGGDTGSLSMATTALGAINLENPAAGLLAPSATVEITDFDTLTNDRLSIAAMLLPTNDGFVGLDSWAIPDTAGTYTIYLNAYDAGSEVNNELVVDGSGAVGTLGIPANPGANGGSAGTGVTSTESNEMIHIHRGNVGDTNDASGVSDVDSRIHRWLNPVAKVVVTVK